MCVRDDLVVLEACDSDLIGGTTSVLTALRDIDKQVWLQGRSAGFFLDRLWFRFLCHRSRPLVFYQMSIAIFISHG